MIYFEKCLRLFPFFLFIPSIYWTYISFYSVADFNDRPIWTWKSSHFRVWKKGTKSPLVFCQDVLLDMIFADFRLHSYQGVGAPSSPTRINSSFENIYVISALLGTLSTCQFDLSLPLLIFMTSNVYSVLFLFFLMHPTSVTFKFLLHVVPKGHWCLGTSCFKRLCLLFLAYSQGKMSQSN